MSNHLIKALLNYDFYEKYKNNLQEDYFPKEVKPLYKTLDLFYKYNSTDITIQDLRELHLSNNPILTAVAIKNLDTILQQIDQIPILSPEVYGTILYNAQLQKKCTEIASLALDIGDGKSSDIAKLENLIQVVNRNNAKKEYDYVTTDLDELLNAVQESYKWKFNYGPLQEVLGGIGPGIFGIVAARPECGKTAFQLNMVFGPGGWIEQGAKVHVIANEEAGAKIMARGLSAYTGFTRQELLTDEVKRSQAREALAYIKQHVFMRDFKDEKDIGLVKEYCKDVKPDILIVDQLDKLDIKGSFAREDQKYKALYVESREIAIRENMAVLGICQAGMDADGKLYYGYEALDGSKTGKAAECDFILCLGMEAISASQGEDTGFRMINIPKNKLTGMHKPVPYMLDAKLSRINL